MVILKFCHLQLLSKVCHDEVPLTRSASVGPMEEPRDGQPPLTTLLCGKQPEDTRNHGGVPVSPSQVQADRELNAHFTQIAQVVP
jgi:hypothetical protein